MRYTRIFTSRWTKNIHEALDEVEKQVDVFGRCFLISLSVTAVSEPPGFCAVAVIEFLSLQAVQEWDERGM